MSHPPQFVLVYDVGGSHVSAAVCESETFRLRGLSQAPLPADGAGRFSAASFGRLIHTLGENAASAAHTPIDRIAGASLAMPGPFDYELGISHMKHKLPALFGVDLKSALAKRFCWQPAQLRFVNDAAAFLLGEMGAGAARGYTRAIGITLGTGIGCAFGIHDQTGSHIAIPPDPERPDQPGTDPGVPPGGEIWNLPYNGATVEDFVSTRFLRGQYQVFTGMEAEVSAIATQASGNHPCPEPPAALPPEDPYAAHCRAREAFRDFGRHLGLVLSQHCAAFSPDVIVFGGGISRAHHLFLPATRKALTGIHAELVISRLMDEAPLTGAGVRWYTAQASA